MKNIEISPLFRKTLDFVNETNRLVFLTGKAGTGKTTLLKHIKQHSPKQITVVAPTGVAAINAEGMTIHSFFQFPFGPFVPTLNKEGEIDVNNSQLPESKYNSRRLSVLRNLELLVIDEVSMVRADMLDQIDLSLRRSRKKWHLPFGGVQVLLIGDLYQLPPVAKVEEWNLLKDYYPTPFFFDSFVIRNNPPVYIELDKVYRQNEQTFLDLLNQVRNNELDEESYELLNSRYKNKFSIEDYRNKVTLTTHNRKADSINERNLSDLSGREYRFRCKIKGNFGENSYPAEEELILKTGARVMFLKNNQEKDYFNGKTGVVTGFDDDKILVSCEENDKPIAVEREAWANVTYSIDKSTHRVKEEVTGEFIQFPLRLAWAITIHKSQGLTFDNLIIDAADSFSAGQVYVALSRCRTLQGLTLSSRIPASALKNDHSVVNFSTTQKNHEKLDDAFDGARKNYIGNILMNLFDFSEIMALKKELAAGMQQFKTRVNKEGEEWQIRVSTLLDSLNDVASKFRNQLAQLMEESNDPEKDERLQERIKKAAGYFLPLLQQCVNDIKNTDLRTESKEAAEDLNPVLQSLVENVFTAGALISSLREKGFIFQDYVKMKMKITFPDVRMNIYANSKNTKVSSDASHPALYRQLLLLRDEICNEELRPVYLVANAQTLVALCNYLPENEDDLLRIPGFGPARIKAFGERFLELIREYMEENSLKSAMHLLKEKKKKNKKTEMQNDHPDDFSQKPQLQKGQSKAQTFELFNKGLNAEQIAKQRGFAVGTIETHLAQFVNSGEIELEKLMDTGKKERILNALKDFNSETGLGGVKSRLPEEITWADLKYVMAYKRMVEEKVGVK